MTATDLFRAFQFTQLTLSRNLDDVTEEESLVVPEGSENSINWLLGHVLAARAQLLRLLGAESGWSEDQILLYSPENRERFAREPMAISRLKSALDDSQRAIEAALRDFEPRLSESTGRKPLFGEGETVLHRLLFLACHEAYHAGQIGLTRRLLGKPGQF
ncbi:MAG: DinB family protein [bacterium]|nr:DinB family protein [bacterium]